MVSFRRVPYLTAFERGQVQREILVAATRGKNDISSVDLNATDVSVLERLDPIP